MGKKIVLGVFGGIALLGLLMSVVGWALGGRVGNLKVEDGEVQYYAGGESVTVGRAPSWMNGKFQVMNWHFSPSVFRQSAYYAEGSIPQNGQVRTLTPAAGADMLKSVSINVSAGYLVIQQGEEPSLTVDGPLECQLEEGNDGSWYIYSNTDVDRITSRQKDGMTRYYDNGRDVTTVFTLTLPKGTQDLTADLSLGEMQVDGIEVENLFLSQDVGAMWVKNCNAAFASLQVDLGSVDASGLQSGMCELHASTGSIRVQGDVRDSLTANCELGSIIVELPRPVGGYTATANAELGHVSVDGVSSFPVSNKSITEGNGELMIDLRCDLGNIEVNFK